MSSGNDGFTVGETDSDVVTTTSALFRTSKTAGSDDTSGPVSRFIPRRLVVERACVRESSI